MKDNSYTVLAPPRFATDLTAQKVGKQRELVSQLQAEVRKQKFFDRNYYEIAGTYTITSSSSSGPNYDATIDLDVPEEAVVAIYAEAEISISNNSTPAGEQAQVYFRETSEGLSSQIISKYGGTSSATFTRWTTASQNQGNVYPWGSWTIYRPGAISNNYRDSDGRFQADPSVGNTGAITRHFSMGYRLDIGGWSGSRTAQWRNRKFMVMIV